MNINVKLLPKQYEFLDSKEKYILYSGGRGSGKSRVLAYAAFREASKPHNKVLLARKTLTDLKASTLESLFEIIPPEAIEYHNKSEGIIKIRGGGILQYRGLDRGMSVRSMNIGCLCLDEAIEFTLEEYEEMAYGLRSKKGSMQVYLATNPGPPNKDQWLYKQFFIDKDKDHKVITSSSYDNFYLPESFFDSFKYMDADRRKRMVDGEWVAIEGQVFKNFSREQHVRILPKSGYEEYYLSIDWGQTHLAAFILCGVTKNIISVIEETAKSDLLIAQIKKTVVKMNEQYRNLQILYDPSAPILANELSNIGIQAFKANNDVNVGIDRIRDRLGNGSLLIDPSCDTLIREFENYVYKGNSEKPVKKGDDCLDALRYVVNEVQDTQGNYIYPKFLDEEEDLYKRDEEDINKEDMWAECSQTENF